VCVKGYYRYEGGGKSEVVGVHCTAFLEIWCFGTGSSLYIILLGTFLEVQVKSRSATCLLSSRTLLPHTCNRSERLNVQQSGVCVPGNYCQLLSSDSVVPLRRKVSATLPCPSCVRPSKSYVAFCPTLHINTTLCEFVHVVSKDKIVRKKAI